IGLEAENNGIARTPGANELLDQRDQLINNLSELVPVRVIEGSQNQVTLFMGDQVLLEGTAQHELSTQLDPADGSVHQVLVGHPGKPLEIGDSLSDSRLASMIASRDEHATGALESIDRLAAQITQSFNLQHAQGMGLDGVTGRGFFAGNEAFAAISG